MLGICKVFSYASQCLESEIVGQLLVFCICIIMKNPLVIGSGVFDVGRGKDLIH